MTVTKAKRAHKRSSILALPSASDFQKYGEVLPSAPERILTMAEKNASSVHKFLWREQSHRFAIQIAILVAGLSLTLVCIMKGMWWPAFAIGIATISGAAFVRTPSRKEAGYRLLGN